MTEPLGVPGPGMQPTTSATATVAGRIFLLDNPRFAHQAPPLAADHSGLVLCGTGSGAKAGDIWRQSPSPLLIDPGAYVSQCATADDPYALPASDDALFGGDLDAVLQGQRQCHAAAAITPSRYVQAGDSAAFKALVRQSAAIERDDVIVTVPVALPWLTQQQYLPQLIAGLQRIKHPKAIMFGAQQNPFDVAAAIPNLRLLLAETTNVGLWRADVPAAFDCLAHGGAFAAIGAGGSLRHLVPADEKPYADNPRAHAPAVLLPAMLRYVRGQIIAQMYASTPAPHCGCQVCGGASLNRFNSFNGEVRAEAHTHNAAVWTGWLSDLFGHGSHAERQLWWRGLCKAAVDFHELENARLRRANAFKPSRALRKLATLPLPHEAASGH
jgi:hypothetical protein